LPFGGLLTLAIGAGVSAAAGIYETNKASDTQQKATDQSLALQKQMYDTTRSDLAPYASIGTGALGNLRTLAGLPAPSAVGTNPGIVPNGIGHTAPAGAPSQGTAVPRAGSGSLSMAGSQSPAQMQTSSGYVTMRAPDGSTAQVDQAHVARAVQLGGQVVG
jgi:hypothetical protein